MQFQFNVDKANYEHLAAGRVILSQGGMTSFPVRLASELFQLCHAYLEKPTLSLYDPCCGGAYLLTCLGFLHHQHISALYGSDIDGAALTTAQKNLALLSQAGLLVRREAIQTLYESYGKASHAEALQSCDLLLGQLPMPALETGVWLADATDRHLAPQSIDLLICDVPYGEKAVWQSDDAEPIRQLLEAHYPSLANHALAVIISDKSQKAAHPKYQRYKQLNHGKRRITILKRAD